jgi:hypothetical protein
MHKCALLLATSHKIDAIQLAGMEMSQGMVGLGRGPYWRTEGGRQVRDREVEAATLKCLLDPCLLRN